MGPAYVVFEVVATVSGELVGLLEPASGFDLEGIACVRLTG